MKTVVSIVLNHFTNDNRVLKEVLSLKKSGYSPVVVSLHAEGLKEQENIHGVLVHRIRLKSRNWSKNKLVQLLKYFEFFYKTIKHYRQYEIIHCNDLNTLPIGVFIKQFFNKNTKIIYDAHEYEINDIPHEKKYMIKLKYYLENFLIHYVDGVLTVSDSIAQEYQKMYSISKPLLVLNTPVYQEIKKRNLFREKLEIKKNQNIFLYQGGLSHGRGIETLLKTFQIIYDEHEYSLETMPVLICMGYGVLEKEIQDSAKVYPNIFFHSAVSIDVLLDYTSSADVGILFYENSCLNHKYCSPNKIFEYLMAEIPIIVSNLYEMKRLVEMYSVGVVVEDDTPLSLQNAVKNIMKRDNKVLLENIKKTKKIYHWEEQEKILLKMYKELY